MNFRITFSDGKRKERIIKAKNKLLAIKYVQDNIILCGFAVQGIKHNKVYVEGEKE